MPAPTEPDRDALEEEAFAWLARITSGAATDADRAALMQWRQRDPAHERAFQHASRLWRQVGQASADALVVGEVRRVAGRSRRYLLRAGAVAAAATVVAAGGVRLGFLPYPGEMLADHRTRVGEQRRVAFDELGFDERVSVELNTRSSLSVDKAATPARLTLIGGEAAFTVRAGRTDALVVSVAQGTVSAEDAVFVVRSDGASVRVTCVDGAVDVVQGGRLRLRPAEQAAWESERLLQVAEVDVEVVTGWRRGLLIFRNEPLEGVVAEFNRYRPGLILVASHRAAQRRISGVFHLDRTDEALAHIEQTLGVPMRRLSRYFTVIG
jgi:transmembrane sensor